MFAKGLLIAFVTCLSESMDDVQPITNPSNDHKGGELLHNNEIMEEAKIAVDKEHQIPLLQGLKAYKKAILWSILLSSAVIMEGFDTVLVGLVLLLPYLLRSDFPVHQIGSYLAFPSFNNTFANQVVDGTPSITAPWQAAGKSSCADF